MLIGVLAVQGAFVEHQKMLTELGVNSLQIRNKNDLTKPFEGLVFPGGESTAMLKILNDFDMFDTLKSLVVKQKIPVLATCAGLILLAQNVVDEPEMNCLQAIPITVKRNAYGRQIDSFTTVGEVKNVGSIPLVFIRAPLIKKVANDVDILCQVNGDIVAVQKENKIAMSFHPELTDSTKMHEYFLQLVEKNKTIF